MRRNYPGFFAKKATSLCNHYIDWSRAGVLIRSGTHQYSTSELIERSIMLVSTALSSYLTYSAFSNDESSSIQCGSLALVGAAMGLTASHIVAWPLIKKRVQLKKDCMVLQNTINKQLNTLKSETLTTSDAHEKVQQLVKYIMSSSNDQNYIGASQTWGRRKRLLEAVVTHLNDDIQAFDGPLSEQAADAFNHFWETYSINELLEISLPQQDTPEIIEARRLTF